MTTPLLPVLGKSVYIAPTSYVGGEVSIGDHSTIMHHVMIRGDIAPIRIGARVNIQDGSILHTKRGIPLDIADDVGVGHRAIVHCRSIGTRSLIGSGAIILDDCEIGARCLIAAGALLAPGTKIPGGHVVMGMPGKIVRTTSEQDLETIDHVVRSYIELGRLHAENRFPNIVQGGSATPSVGWPQTRR
jgi:carbonic anhydrase/acetyltransferase-like protein (isoleucine patch superfamily)